MVETRRASEAILRLNGTDMVVLGMCGAYPEGVLGIRVAEALRERLPEGIRVLVSSTLDREFSEIDGVTHLLVVDSVDIARPPGTVVLWDGEALTPCVAQAMFREIALVHHLVLAGMHADAPEEIALLGVQPGGSEEPELSPEVEAALPVLVEEALAVIGAWLDPTAPGPTVRERPPNC